MVFMMLILENLLGLKSKQADVTASFLHAILGEVRCLISSSVVQTESQGSLSQENLSGLH